MTSLDDFVGFIHSVNDPSMLLPVNLPSNWLHELRIDISELADSEDTMNSSRYSMPLALVLRLREEKGMPADIPINELYEQLQALRMEVELEHIRRKFPDSNPPPPATMENILTHRDV